MDESRDFFWLEGVSFRVRVVLAGIKRG